MALILGGVCGPLILILCGLKRAIDSKQKMRQKMSQIIDYPYDWVIPPAHWKGVPGAIAYTVKNKVVCAVLPDGSRIAPDIRYKAAPEGETGAISEK